jgi:hypothetical protein
MIKDTVITLLLILMFIGTVKAQDFLPTITVKGYSDAQYCQAIFKAEGGFKAKYLYGIRSVPYNGIREAKQICLKTIRHNRKRYLQYGHKRYKTFIQFLASVYCPTRGSKLTKSEKRLNCNWIRLVTYFLKKDK